MRFALAIALSFALVSTAAAAPVILQPDESTSKDSFVYEFLPTFNFNNPPFGSLLSSGKTTSGHDTRSFLQFDLTGITLDTGETATLNLYVGNTASAGFGVNPSPATPVAAEVYYLTSAWDEATVSWGNQPSIGTILIDSVVIDGISQWVSFDITSLVSVWLANPATNFGLAVVQPTAVTNGGFVVAVYDSAADANKPYVQIPEPAVAVVFLGIGVAHLTRRASRRI